MKIVVNSCFGGFRLSAAALEDLGIEYSGDIDRDSPDVGLDSGSPAVMGREAL